MENDIKKIKCPKCGASISIDDVLTHQIEDKLKQDYKDKEKTLRESIEREAKKELVKREEELKKQLQKQLLQESDSEKKLLEKQLKEKDAKLQKATENEIVLRQEKNKLEEAKKDFKIEKQRQLDEERKSIFQEASKKATEEQHYVIAQLKKQLSDATKVKDELARKLEQGSQQSQGEVLELELEDLLKTEFKYDDISPVPKGINGADVIQTVKTRAGIECGKIIWESKKTKSWIEGWIQKLKDDQRNAKAEIAVIVSSVLPKDVIGAVFRDGVWVCDITFAIPIATALRQLLESSSRERGMSIGKNEKMEPLYSYVTSNVFIQRIQAIVEVWKSMSDSLIKERNSVQKSWNEREGQIQKFKENMTIVLSDLNAVVPLKKVDLLELPEPKVAEIETKQPKSRKE